ncbi:MAG TPA: acyl carrier protein [Caulobacteraceae bacterium]|nr:acyl carrier protein [Caulobacteraceae bacterium]
MTRDEAIARIEPIFRDLFDEYDGPVVATLSAADVDQWDSLANVQLIVMVEHAFGARFSTDEILELKNLGELAALIVSKAA